jgi:hypothetical protein
MSIGLLGRRSREKISTQRARRKEDERRERGARVSKREGRAPPLQKLAGHLKVAATRMGWVGL